MFTAATPAPQTSTANFESSTNTNFQNYTNRINFELMDHTDISGSTYTYSQKLTGGNNAQVGVAKSYKVYPGDKVKIEAYSKYYNPQGTQSNLAGFALALTSAFGVSSSSTGEALKAYNSLNSYGSVIAAGGGGGSSSYPKLFVNILLFDKDFNFVDAAWQQIDGGEQVGATPKAAHDYMMKEVTIQKEGFAYVYVSNENATLVEFYVDDVSVTHTPSNVIQYNEYYPFGEATQNSWTRENNFNNYLFNAGSEKNNTTGNYEMLFREYDPILGRMNAVDPMASKYASLTPYNYSFNSPTVFNDPNGADPYYGDESYSYSQVRHITPGSGNHWSDHLRGGYGMSAGDFLIMALHSANGGTWTNGSYNFFTSSEARNVAGSYQFENYYYVDYSSGGLNGNNSTLPEMVFGQRLVQSPQQQQTQGGGPGNPPGLPFGIVETSLMSGGITLPGIGIFVEPNDGSLTKHEVGHYLQFLRDGGSYFKFYKNIGAPSLYNAIEQKFVESILGIDPKKVGLHHDNFRTETDANKLIFGPNGALEYPTNSISPSLNWHQRLDLYINILWYTK